MNATPEQLRALRQETNLINRFLKGYTNSKVFVEYGVTEDCWILRRNDARVFTRKDFDSFFFMLTGYRVGIRSGFFLERKKTNV